MLRRLLVAILPLVLGALAGAGLGGCAKPDLPALTVRAADAEDLAAFRSELGARFTPGQLQPFDTALQELQLAGMDKLPAAADRAAAMRAAVHGQTVRAAEILGWQARRMRLLAEIAPMAETLARDRQTQAQKGAGISVIVANRIQNVQDILARLRRDLAATEQQLTAWGAPMPPATARPISP